jgi:hypothetical protein
MVKDRKGEFFDLWSLRGTVLEQRLEPVLVSETDIPPGYVQPSQQKAVGLAAESAIDVLPQVRRIVLRVRRR